MIISESRVHWSFRPPPFLSSSPPVWELSVFSQNGPWTSREFPEDVDKKEAEDQYLMDMVELVEGEE